MSPAEVLAPAEALPGRAGRLAETRVPIHPAIASRWSPRMFDASAIVSAEQITALLEAARWAATWWQRQPVRLVVGMRGDDTFGKLCRVLKRGNAYAKAASAMVLVCADEEPDDRTLRYSPMDLAVYSALDAGAAIAQLTIEAVSRGLVVHPMGGFYPAGACTAFSIPDGVRPLAVVAIGSLGDYANATPDIVDRDAAPRGRLALEQIAFAGTWGTPFRPEACPAMTKGR